MEVKFILSRNTPPAPELPAMGRTFKHDLVTVGSFPLVEGMHCRADAGEQGMVLACHGRRFCRTGRAAQHGLLGGGDWDVVAAANTLYVQPSGGLASAFLDEVDVTSGQVTFVSHENNVPPGVGISDLAVAETGVSRVAEPTTAFLFLSSLAGLIGIGRRRRGDRAAPPNLP